MPRWFVILTDDDEKVPDGPFPLHRYSYVKDIFQTDAMSAAEEACEKHDRRQLDYRPDRIVGVIQQEQMRAGDPLIEPTSLVWFAVECRSEPAYYARGLAVEYV